MDKASIKAAVDTIELQLDLLRSAAGLASDEDDEGEADESDNKTKPTVVRARRRGRAKLMPVFKANDDEDN